MSSVLTSACLFTLAVTSAVTAQYSNPDLDEFSSSLQGFQFAQESISESAKMKDPALKYSSQIIDKQFKGLFVKQEENYRFDPVGSLGENIRFSGFYERFAFISYSPKMFIKPADFIQFYSHHELLKVVPLDNARSAGAEILIESLVLVGTEALVHLAARESTWISELAAFAVKNLLMELALRPKLKTSNKSFIPWIQDESFYCSMSIRF
jgi:hypothetical protein